MSGPVLEDPPPIRRNIGGLKQGGRGRLAPWMAEAIDFARAHPDRWARVRVFDYPPSEAVRRLKQLGLEATFRRVDGDYRLYARAPGGEPPAG